MLSFMREQTLEDLTAQGSPGAAGGVPKDSSGAGGGKPLGGEGSQEQEYVTVATHAQDVRKTTFLLAVLFVIGLVCVLFMIKKSGLRTATADVGNTEDTEIKTAIARLTGVRSEVFSRMDEIVKKFYEFSDVEQVDVNELAKNPFKREMLFGDLGQISTGRGGPDAGAEVIRQQQLRQRAKDLQLLSIMKSEQGKCCMLDDRIVSVGDSIKGFKIKQISDSFVLLESEGVQVILKLSE